MQLMTDVDDESIIFSCFPFFKTDLFFFPFFEFVVRLIDRLGASSCEFAHPIRAAA